jgi:hypothetical protein
LYEFKFRLLLWLLLLLFFHSCCYTIISTVKPTTTYTFISQKIKETQKKRSDLFLFYKLKLVYSTSFNRVWKHYKREKKNFWLVDNIQNGLLIGSQYKYIVHCMNLNLDFCFDCYYYCFFHSCCYTIIMSNHVKTFYAENI